MLYEVITIRRELGPASALYIPGSRSRDSVVHPQHHVTRDRGDDHFLGDGRARAAGEGQLHAKQADPGIDSYNFV